MNQNLYLLAAALNIGSHVYLLTTTADDEMRKHAYFNLGVAALLAYSWYY